MKRSVKSVENAIISFDLSLWHFQLSQWQELTTVLQLSTVFNVFFGSFFAVFCAAP